MSDSLNHLYRQASCYLLGHRRFTGWIRMTGRGYEFRACLCCQRVERRSLA